MKYFRKNTIYLSLVLFGALGWGLDLPAQVPSQPQPGKLSKSNNIVQRDLEGVSLRFSNSSILVLANASIQKTASHSRTNNEANSFAPTFLQKIGPYEIHRATPSASAKAQASGQSLPTFAQVPKGADFVGAAYFEDSQRLGLISKEVVIKFKGGKVPSEYQAYKPVEVVRGSGLYLFAVSDVYEWIKVVSRLQADSQVAVVDPQIITEFATPQ
jgi:hypothetical protein